MLPDRIVIPFTALGLPEGESVPTRFCVCVAGPQDITHFCGGFVLTADTFDYEDDAVGDPSDPHRRPLGATADGLFDERIFGPLLRGADGLPNLACPLDIHPHDRPQGRLFGTLMPHEPVTSTWANRYAPQATPPRLDLLPVLPAGLRPTFLQDGNIYSSDLTTLYKRVINYSRRLMHLIELDAPEIIVENERTSLQRAVDALLVDGVTMFSGEPDEEDDGVEWVSDPEEARERIDAGESPIGKLLSLRGHMLLRAPARFFRWLEAELARNQRVMSAERWPADAHLWRTYLAAACLEIVPLDGAGAIDHARLQTTREDRFVQITNEVHDLVFDECLGVLHTQTTQSSPHVDVYAYREEGEIVLVTSGMSMLPMAGVNVELVCVLAGDTDDATRVAVMRVLQAIALLPARRGTHLAVNHTIHLDEALVASGIRAVTLDFADALDFIELFCDVLPMHPTFLLAVPRRSQL